MWATGQGSAAPWGVGFLSEAVSQGHLALEMGGLLLFSSGRSFSLGNGRWPLSETYSHLLTQSLLQGHREGRDHASQRFVSQESQT